MALINQVFLNNTSDPLLHGNPITSQCLNAIPQHLQNRHQMSASDSRNLFRTADQTVHGQCLKSTDLLHSQCFCMDAGFSDNHINILSIFYSLIIILILFLLSKSRNTTIKNSENSLFCGFLYKNNQYQYWPLKNNICCSLILVDRL